MKLFLPPVIGCALFLSLAGCASRSDYASFATAGQAYAKASSSLIQASSEIDMDDKSEILLESRNERLEIIAGIKADKSLSDEAREKKIKENLAKLEKKYCSTQEGQLKRLRVQQKLIAHNKLLADYFEQLALLAGGSQPKDIGAELKNTADSLNNIGKQLRAEALTANTDAFKQLGEVGVDLAIRSVLREELLTQELLLQALARQMKNQVKDQLIRDEENNVIGPFLGDGKINRADWKKERKRILTASFTSE